MSNVLIGIIGVILFIGLALAGALFLGPRFQESTQNSKASTAVQAVKQMSDAIVMYETQEGRRYSVDVNGDGLKQAGYLKSLPVSPIGAVVIEDLGDGRMAVIRMRIEATDIALCGAVAKQTVGGGVRFVSEQDVPRVATGTTGCYYDGGNDQLLVYAKV